MKSLIFVLLLSASAYAEPVVVDGHPLSQAPAPHASYSLSSSKLSIGAGLGEVSFDGESAGMNGIGILGDYKIDRNWFIEGRFFTSSHDIHYSQYAHWWNCYSWNQDLKYNQVDLYLGPTYRVLTKKFSPILGAGVQFTHRYYELPSYGYYGGYQQVGSSDELYMGMLFGLEYKITKDVSIGLDLMYFIPVSYTSANLPFGYPHVENQNYYSATVNMKFSL